MLGAKVHGDLVRTDGGNDPGDLIPVVQGFEALLQQLVEGLGGGSGLLGGGGLFRGCFHSGGLRGCFCLHGGGFRRHFRLYRRFHGGFFDLHFIGHLCTNLLNYPRRS